MALAESRREKFVEIIADKRGQMYGFIIFTIIVVLVLMVGAIRPTLVTIFRLREEIAQKEILIDQLDTKTEALSSLSNDYNEIREDLADMELVFPARGDFSLFMSNIEEVSKQNGFVLTNISFTEARLAVLPQTYALKPWSAAVTLKGESNGFIKLLRDIEKTPFYTTVSSVNYSTDVDEEGDTEFTVVFIIYRLEKPDFYED